MILFSIMYYSNHKTMFPDFLYLFRVMTSRDHDPSCCPHFHHGEGYVGCRCGGGEGVDGYRGTEKHTCSQAGPPGQVGRIWNLFVCGAGDSERFNMKTLPFWIVSAIIPHHHPSCPEVTVYLHKVREKPLTHLNNHQIVHTAKPGQWTSNWNISVWLKSPKYPPLRFSSQKYYCVDFDG